MTHPSDEEVIRLLRTALPVRQQSTNEDLWPRVRDRIERGASPPTKGDWILLALVTFLCLLEPAIAGMLLFHL